jgi:hypothetical protein
MGIVLQRTVFAGEPPSLTAIAESLERVTGLAAAVEDTRLADGASLYALHARVAFACDPAESVTVYAYPPGAVKAFCGEAFADSPPWMTNVVEGVHDTPERRTVYVRGYAGQEPTLLVAMDAALEALGGAPEPLSRDAIEPFDVRVTPAELVRRRRKNRRQGYWMMAVVVPITLIALPISLVWAVVTMPWRVWRGYRAFIRWRTLPPAARSPRRRSPP